MWLFAGLGNPGKEYAETRHNIGFMVLERIAENWTAGAWKDKYSAEISQVETSATGKVLLVKPQSYMNKSGEPISRLASFYKVLPETILVIHDEVDLPFGQLRIKSGGGHGGHNGLRSVKDCLGSAQFVRLRVGVGRPPEEQKDREMSDWVLGNFSKEEKVELKSLIERAAIAAEAVLLKGVKAAQNSFN